MEKQKNKKNRKTLKIILIVVISAAIIAAGVALVCFFVKKIPETTTQYGTVKNVVINSDSSFTLRLSAPYSSSKIEYASDDSADCILKKDGSGKAYKAVVGKMEYDSLKNDDIHRGTAEITFEVKDGFAFEDGGTYVFEMPDKTVTEKNSNTSVGEVKIKFSTQKAGADSFSATIEHLTDLQLEDAQIIKASIEKTEDRYFLSIEIKGGELTKLNEQAIKNLDAGVTYAFKGESINMVTVFEDITLHDGESSDTVVIRCPIKKDDVISGKEYAVSVAQTLLINEKGTKGSCEMNATFTYMG